jgi:hypothetical protein
MQHKTQIQVSPYQSALQFVEHKTNPGISTPNRLAICAASDIHKLVNSVWDNKEFPH